MFDTTIDQIKALRGNNEEIVIVKLGQVTELSGGKAKVKLYGDDQASNKLFNYLDGYIPEIGDKVALLPQGRTYIILGKISDAIPEEKYATIVWVTENFLGIEYKNKLEDDSDTLTLSGNALLPAADNTDDLGSSAKNFKKAYVKALVLNGTEYTEIKQDRIQVTSSGTTYSLIATVSSGIITLTPSTNDSWVLGTKTVHLKDAWLGLFRGTWKSGQTTERALSWNSSNAIVPDSSNAIDLGTASAVFKELFLTALVGAKWKYQSNSTSDIEWNSATELVPNAADQINLGSAVKQFNKIYSKEFYINGTKLDISGITLDKLTATYGNTNYTLTLSVKSGGTSGQYEELTPSVNAKFDLGNANYKFRYFHFAGWSDGTRNVSWSSHELIPDTTNQVSLGNANKQYKNIYGQNIYVNGTAVSSDERIKDDIRPLDDRYDDFFKLLKPCGFKFKDGDSGRTHTGFIAQEVEQAAAEAGLDGKDIAVVVKDESDRYYLRYEEIIAVQTKVIQDLMAKVETLEARINKLEVERSKT